VNEECILEKKLLNWPPADAPPDYNELRQMVFVSRPCTFSIFCCSGSRSSPLLATSFERHFCLTPLRKLAMQIREATSIAEGNYSGRTFSGKDEGYNIRKSVFVVRASKHVHEGERLSTESDYSIG
jgi:hypothetical protein